MNTIGSNEVVLAGILQNKPADTDMVKWIANELSRIDAIRRDMVVVQRERLHAKEEYDRRLASLDAKVKELQTKCKHESRDFNSDPAGGRDSYHSCNICGKTI